MKHLFTLKTIMLACLLCVGMGAWAADVVSYTFKTAQSSANSAYATNYNVEVDNKTWSCPGNQNYDGYVRIGGKNLANEKREIYSKTTLTDDITKVVLNHNGVSKASLIVHSIKLTVASDSAFTTDVQTKELPSPSVSSPGSLTFSPTSGTWGANKYYKITFELTNNNNNKNYGIDVASIVFYKDNGGAPQTKYNVTVANNIANGTVTASPTSAAEGEEVTLTATPASGYMFGSWNVTNASTSESITVTDNKFTMPAADVNVSATFTAIPEKTIAEFIASEGGKCYLTGIVSNIASTTYGNFDLTDESGTVYVYGCLTPGGESKQFASLDVVAGDKIKVLADEYVLYNGKHEAKNVVFVEEIAVPKAQYTVTIETPENGTLVVKEDERVLSSGDKVEEGETITIECNPANADYRYKNWQYKEDGNWITMTSTMTRTVTQDISIRANFELIPVYTVSWSVNGSTVKSEDLKEGADVTAPDVVAPAGKVFLGWATSPIDGTTNVAPQLVTPNATATAAATYYAVFATASTNEAGITAYTAGNTGNYVLAVYDNSKWYALPNNPTVNSGKIAGVEITVSTNSSSINYVTSANANGYAWTIANATNGQTISDGTKYIYHSNGGSSDTNLSYGNSTDYTWKIESEANGLTFKGMSGSTVNTRGMLAKGTSFGGYSLDNKDTKGYNRVQVLPILTTTYSDYCTTVAAPVYNEQSLTLAATDGTDYYATFSSSSVTFWPSMDGDLEYATDVKKVSVDGSALTLTTLDEEKGYNDLDGFFVPANTGVLVKVDFDKVETTVPYYTVTNKNVAALENNALIAGTGSTPTDGDEFKYYKLAYDAENASDLSTLGFYWGANDGAPFNLTVGKAYLKVAKNAGVKSFRFGGNTTGIKTVNNGQIINKAVKRIMNGQLVIEKAGKMYNAAGAEMK